VVQILGQINHAGAWGGDEKIGKNGVSILLVEQDMSFALKAAIRDYSLQVGSIAMQVEIEKFR